MFNDSTVYAYFLGKISVTKDDYIEEQKFLFDEIERCKTVEDVNTSFDTATDYIKKKLRKYPKFWPREEIKKYINEYRALYVRVKNKANKQFDEINGTRAVNSSPEGYKECAECKVLLDLNEFSSNHNSKDGYNNICKDCVTIRKENKKDTKHKTCVRCKKRKLKTSYHKNGRTKDKLEKWCKVCVSKAIKGEVL